MKQQGTTGTGSKKASTGMIEQLLRAGQLLFDSRVPFTLKLLLPVAAVLYWLWPIDLMPGLPFDDVAVLIGALLLFAKLASEMVESKQQDASQPESKDDSVVDTTWRAID